MTDPILGKGKTYGEAVIEDDCIVFRVPIDALPDIVKFSPEYSGLAGWRVTVRLRSLRTLPTS